MIWRRECLSCSSITFWLLERRQTTRTRLEFPLKCQGNGTNRSDMRSSVKPSSLFKMGACALSVAWQIVGADAEEVTLDASNVHGLERAAHDRVQAASSNAGASQASRANPLWGIPVDSLIATRDFPLFSPSRQPAKQAAVPFQAPVVALPVERFSPPNLSLVGVIMRGDGGAALFADNTTKSLLRLNIGESHNGWKLVSVDGRRVTLQRKEARVEL